MVADAKKLGIGLFTVGLSTVDRNLRPTGKCSWKRVEEAALVRGRTQVSSRHGTGARPWSFGGTFEARPTPITT